jgi:hypothetical protein
MRFDSSKAWIGFKSFAVNGGGVNDFGIAAGSNGNLLFGTNGGYEVMRLTTGGNVGIGMTPLADRRLMTRAPTASNLVFEGVESGGIHSIYLRPNTSNVNLVTSNYLTGGTYLPLALSGRENTSDFVLNAGNVGIGTAAPGYKLEIVGNARASSNLYVDGDLTGTGPWGVPNAYVDTVNSKATNDPLEINYRTAAPTKICASVGCATFSAYFSTNGYVGLGKTDPTARLDVDGDIKVSGNISAKYQDVAEWVPSSEQLSARTVVVLDSTKSNQVTSSTTSYDTRVAGVVSEQPGIALGEKSAGKVLVATTGRVRVKVDATKSPIHIGDLLVTSDIPGVAMKSEPVEFGGRKMHMPGTIIGKALEPLESGKGEILVLLSLQ